MRASWPGALRIFALLLAIWIIVTNPVRPIQPAEQFHLHADGSANFVHLHPGARPLAQPDVQVHRVPLPAAAESPPAVNPGRGDFVPALLLVAPVLLTWPRRFRRAGTQARRLTEHVSPPLAPPPNQRILSPL